MAWRIVEQIAGIGRVLVVRSGVLLVWRNHSELLPRPATRVNRTGRRRCDGSLSAERCKTGMMTSFNATQQWAGIVFSARRPSVHRLVPTRQLSAARIMGLVDGL